MKNRIRLVRKDAGLNQTDFGKALGVSLSAVFKWESGENELSDAVILLMCQKFNINETWLRTGAGEMHGDKSHEEELGAAVAKLMVNRPDSFKAAVVAALLKFDPDGPEWTILERIYNDIADQWAKEKAGE